VAVFWFSASSDHVEGEGCAVYAPTTSCTTTTIQGSIRLHNTTHRHNYTGQYFGLRPHLTLSEEWVLFDSKQGRRLTGKKKTQQFIVRTNECCMKIILEGQVTSGRHEKLTKGV
jgi:hypothetical protein